MCPKAYSIAAWASECWPILLHTAPEVGNLYHGQKIKDMQRKNERIQLKVND
jgi:hypothetical protein